MTRPITFRDAVTQTPALQNAYHKGLHGLEKADQKRIDPKNADNITGSVNLDAALARTYPNDPRWDYGVGVRERGKPEYVVWVEVHSAATAHGADEVCKKHLWLKQWLTASAPLLNRMNRMANQYVWIASGKVAIPKNCPQQRRLAVLGIRFAGRTLRI